MVEDAALESWFDVDGSGGHFERCLEDVSSIHRRLDHEWNRQRHGNQPGWNDEGRHVTSLTDASHVQRISDAVVSVESDCTQVHDGSGGKYDVTSCPKETRVEPENPASADLQSEV